MNRKLVLTALVTAMIIPFSVMIAQAEAPPGDTASGSSSSGGSATGSGGSADPASGGTEAEDPCAMYEGTGVEKAPLPFGSLKTTQDNPCDKVEPVSLGKVGGETLDVPHADLLFGWMPWLIQTFSILIGAVAVCVFSYAGINIIIHGDNPEEVAKSTKMLIYGVIGITVAALSYSIVANVLGLFT